MTAIRCSPGLLINSCASLIQRGRLPTATEIFKLVSALNKLWQCLFLVGETKSKPKIKPFMASALGNVQMCQQLCFFLKNSFLSEITACWTTFLARQRPQNVKVPMLFEIWSQMWGMCQNLHAPIPMICLSDEENSQSVGNWIQITSLSLIHFVFFSRKC